MDVTSAFWLWYMLVTVYVYSPLVAGTVIAFVSSESIQDMHVINGRIHHQFTAIGRHRCYSECYTDDDCVTLAYSLETEVCQFYQYDLQNYVKNTIPQANTIFFRAACNRRDYTLVRSLGLCIKRHDDVMVWDDAFQTCYLENANILWLDTAQKRSYFQNTLANVHVDGESYFLGGYNNKGTNPDWVWSDGFTSTSINATNGGQYWDIDEPAGDLCCLAIYSNRVYLRAENCTLPSRFICAYPIYQTPSSVLIAG